MTDVTEVADQEEVQEPEVCEEATKVLAHRRQFFKTILGRNCSDEDIERLVVSQASPHDALRLRNMECPDHLIVEILV